jgi:hypothetical protein
VAGNWIVNRLLWIIRSYVAYVSKDIFTIDKFEYDQKTHDVYICYHINGKRVFQNRKRVDEIILDNKLINSFSRIDAMKIGQLYGRSQEKKRLTQLREIEQQERDSDE